jgi:hypothetical protein
MLCRENVYRRQSVGWEEVPARVLPGNSSNHLSPELTPPCPLQGCNTLREDLQSLREDVYNMMSSNCASPGGTPVKLPIFGKQGSARKLKKGEKRTIDDAVQAAMADMQHAMAEQVAQLRTEAPFCACASPFQRTSP